MIPDDDVFPRPLTSRVQGHMDKIANAILEYEGVTGALPQGGNADMVKALQSLSPRIFWKRELNAQGAVLDPWGRPYVYVAPGVVNPGQFDLYSVGPGGKGETNAADRILCELFRI